MLTILQKNDKTMAKKIKYFLILIIFINCYSNNITIQRLSEYLTILLSQKTITNPLNINKKIKSMDLPDEQNNFFRRLIYLYNIASNLDLLPQNFPSRISMHENKVEAHLISDENFDNNQHNHKKFLKEAFNRRTEDIEYKFKVNL